jgi:hypothetical protein
MTFPEFYGSLMEIGSADEIASRAASGERTDALRRME